MTDFDSQVSELRDIVRKLAATGEDGFEGLMAAVLTDVTKTGFALAKAGSQHGKDGQSILNAGAIGFEGKLYDSNVPKNEVLSKIAEIAANDDGETDLWILGSTGTVATQDINTVAALGKKLAIATVFLDWSTTGLPALATLLAMAPAVTASFLSPRTGTSKQDILVKLDAVRGHIQFGDRVRELNASIEQPSVGPAYAAKHNDEWLCKTFTNTGRARNVLGQPLAPGDAEVSGVLDRTALRQSLSKIAFGKPNGAVTAILGADGNGKSWLFAQAWMHETAKPLSVILVPDDIKPQFSPDSIEELLISTLIVQTGDSSTEISRGRWRKHFDRWKRSTAVGRPRLVVFMDGVNQRESVHWKKFINSLGQVLADLGGKLVFSCRTPFFRSTLRGFLVADIEPFDVPEWTNPELESLLAERGTSIAKLSPTVVDFLRNPRIFAVAAELFKNRQIEQFTELSVSRLLFEHIRMGASPAADPMPAADFVRGIREHADEIVKRLRQTQTVDLKIFERSSGSGQSALNLQLGDRFAITSAGRFFEALPEDPRLYVLKDDGLPLALGLSLLGTAQRARRNQLNIENELSKILDPISALDNTADVLISALVAAVLGDDTPNDIVAALVTAFVALQNLDAGRYEEFRALSRRAPAAFLKALENAVLAEGVTSNLSWLTQALLENRQETESSQAIAKFVHRWLSMYSPAPERMGMAPQSAGNDERAKEWQKRKDAIDAKLAAFSQTEKTLLGSLVLEERGDYTRLNRIALQFLAGTALKSFGESFRNWCFAASFNGGFNNAHDDFEDLVQFNRVDWIDTRVEILKAAEILRGDDISDTGRWALVYLLRATADSSDAAEAIGFIEKLTKDREKFGAWRLVENWCATDPCDPNSERPDNIDSTVAKYAALNVSQLKNHRAPGIEDNFFDGALVGLARFAPDAALGTMRRLAADVLTRGNADFRTAIFSLNSHTAALDDALATQFVDRASQIAMDSLSQEDKNKELFVASQYGLSIAFPHMAGDDQLRVLMAHPKVDNILLPVCDLMQPCDPMKYEAALEKAYADGDTVNQFRLMVFGEYSETPITDRAKAIVGMLTASTDRLARLCALGLVRRLKDPTLLGVVAASDWDANKLDSASDKFESWYGSEALVLAAEKNLLSVDDCMARIALSAYLSFVRMLGLPAALAVASRIGTAISKAAGYEANVNLPDIEQRVGQADRPAPFDIEDKPGPQESMGDSIKRLSETGDVWYERQLRNREAVEKFERELTRAGAQLIIQSVMPDLIGEIFEHDPSIVRTWHQLLLSLDSNALSRVHNIALAVAQIVARDDQMGAVALFEKLSSSNPVVRITFGLSQVTLDAMAVWNAGDGGEMRKLRFKRLDRARTDHEISLEVIAATNAGKQNCLREYVIDRRIRPEPAFIARATMVAGLCEASEWAIETIEALKWARGFLSEAYNGAKYAMDRHRWSQHWSKSMGKATTETDMWRCAIILATIVDGRFHGRDVEGVDNNRLLKRYGPTFDDLIRRRIDKWKDKRHKTLFGMKAPDEMFLI